MAGVPALTGAIPCPGVLRTGAAKVTHAFTEWALAAPGWHHVRELHTPLVELPTGLDRDTVAAALAYRSTLLDTTPDVWGQCCVYVHPGVAVSPQRLVMFDLDGTLIQPVQPPGSRRRPKFCSAADDWEWVSPSVPITLRSLAASGTRIVVLSNQGGVASGATLLAVVCARVAAIAAALDVPGLVVMLATGGNDWYRKPAPGMAWLVQLGLLGGEPFPADTLFVGDAAGRPGDFSASDVAFARAAGVDFRTPEAYFAAAAASAAAAAGFSAVAPIPPPLFVPAIEGVSTPLKRLPALTGPAIVLLIGLPAVGKTTYAQRVLGAVHAQRAPTGTATVMISGDDYTPAAAVRVARPWLAGGAIIVVDATNGTRIARRRWLTLGFDVPVHAVVFGATKATALHLAAVRTCNPFGSRQKVPAVAVHTAAKRYEAPDAVAEGFASIDTVPDFVVRLPTPWSLPVDWPPTAAAAAAAATAQRVAADEDALALQVLTLCTTA